MHNIFGFFALPFLLRDLSNATMSLSQLHRELQIESKSVTEYCIISDWRLHCQSHTHTQDIIISEDSGARSRRHLLPPSLHQTPPLTRTIYFSFTSRPPPPFASGSHECRSIPEGSSCLHHNFSCWPFLLLVFTCLSAVTAAAPAPVLLKSELWVGCAI